MIKKLIILFLAVFYLNVSGGVGLHFHYCMGELVSLAFGHQEDDHHMCERCGMDMKDNTCCKEESVILKLNDSHQPTSFVSGISKFSFSEHTYTWVKQSSFQIPFDRSLGIYFADRYFDPPSLSRYLSIRVLRI